MFTPDCEGEGWGTTVACLVYVNPLVAQGFVYTYLFFKDSLTALDDLNGAHIVLRCSVRIKTDLEIFAF